MILCVDPASRTGWATSDGRYGCWDIAPLGALKGRKTKAGIVGARPAEPDEARLWKLHATLTTTHTMRPVTLLVHERALQHHASARSAQIAHELQAALKLWAWQYGVRRVDLSPLDLQRFALGRAARPKSDDMLQVAKVRLGYAGTDDNEADALLLLEWARVHGREWRAGA